MPSSVTTASDRPCTVKVTRTVPTGPRVRGVARQTPGRRPVGHVAGGDRRLPHPGAQGRPKTGPSPVDRRKPGSKHHVITDAGGIPLATALTGGNRHDVTQLMPLVDKVPRIKDPRPAPAATRPHLRRSRLRLRLLPPRPPGQGHYPGHRPTRHRPRLRTRHPTLGRRTDHRPAALAPLRCGIGRRVEPFSGSRSDRLGEFGKRCGDPCSRRGVDGEFVVSAAEVLHERVPSDDHLCRLVRP